MFKDCNSDSSKNSENSSESTKNSSKDEESYKRSSFYMKYVLNECPSAFLDSAMVGNPKEILESLWTIRVDDQDSKYFGPLITNFPSYFVKKSYKKDKLNDKK